MCGSGLYNPMFYIIKHHMKMTKSSKRKHKRVERDCFTWNESWFAITSQYGNVIFSVVLQLA